jgi:SAM-dependent methyltransferase
MPQTETSSQDSALWAVSTGRFYDEHAEEYFEKTVHANLAPLYERFLPRVPHRGRILDVGCGSGRDLKAFKSRGYRPFGIDASSKLVRLAREYSGVECEVGRLQDIAYAGEFDAVWACASLLHLPKSELGEALKRLRRALVKNGLLFASVQIGQGEQVAPDGRFYAYYDQQEFVRAVQGTGFVVEDSWRTEDTLLNRSSVSWVNVLARA